MTSGGKRPGAGRPKAEEPREHIEAVRLTETEWRVLHARATANDKTVSAVILAALKRHLRQKPGK